MAYFLLRFFRHWKFTAIHHKNTRIRIQKGESLIFFFFNGIKIQFFSFVEIVFYFLHWKKMCRMRMFVQWAECLERISSNWKSCFLHRCQNWRDGPQSTIATNKSTQLRFRKYNRPWLIGEIRPQNCTSGTLFSGDQFAFGCIENEQCVWRGDGVGRDYKPIDCE